jgi:hypothetical protein
MQLESAPQALLLHKLHLFHSIFEVVVAHEEQKLAQHHGRQSFHLSFLKMMLK